MGMHRASSIMQVLPFATVKLRSYRLVDFGVRTSLNAPFCLLQHDAISQAFCDNHRCLDIRRTEGATSLDDQKN
jgi:hypothetical protein